MFNLLIIFGAKYLLWILVVIALIWFLKQSREKQKQIIFFGVTALPIIFLISRLVGRFYYDPRPFVVGHFVPLIPHEPDNGFPSDHTLLGAALASVIYLFNRKISWIAWIFTILIGVSRVLAGIHHLVDIAGSIIISIFAGFFVYHVLFSRFNPRRNKNF